MAKQEGKTTTKKEVGIVPVGDTTLSMPTTYEDQVKLIFLPTPQAFIKQREGRGGKIFDYVETNYVTARLNATFLCDWDLDVIEEKIFKELGQIATKVKLTVRFIGGRTISKTAWGGSDIKLKNGKIIDIADDLKASQSDAIKKAASLIGICWDVYSGVANGKGEKAADAEVVDEEPEYPESDEEFEDIADIASNPDEDAQEAKSIAEWIKLYLESKAIDYKDFKQFLMDTKWNPSRKFVGKQFGNLSLSEGNLEDLRYLKKNITKCIDKYLSKRMDK